MNNYTTRLISSKIEEAHRFFPVIVVTGPRQSGKTSLCRHLFPEYKYVNLENITTRSAAVSDPTAFVDELGKCTIIDEVQHSPELLSMIQVKVDENRDLRFILTGSSNFSLLRSVSQSLAGRAALFTLLPFSFKEVAIESLASSTDDLMWRGSYPGVIADSIPPFLFYQNYYNTYVERDLRDLLKVKNIFTFDKFIRLLAARVGSEFNASSLARETGVSSTTISEWLSLLTTSYIAYSLPPYYTNIGKRLTKMPKIYFYDTGLLCYLLGIEDATQLDNHPLRGSIFENMAMNELLKDRLNQAKDPSLYFYREHAGREIDAMVFAANGIELYEVKTGKTFKQEYVGNMKSVEPTLGNVVSSTVIYDGDSIPPIVLNIRDI